MIRIRYLLELVVIFFLEVVLSLHSRWSWKMKFFAELEVKIVR